MTESKREKFVRLAESRTLRVREAIQLLSKCASTNAYEYDQEDVKQIFSTLRKDLDNAEAKFKQGNVRDQLTFKLKKR